MAKSVRSITKKELCRVLNVSNSTLQRYLNVGLYKELKELGYDRQSNIIYGKPLQYIMDYFCLQDEDF